MNLIMLGMGLVILVFIYSIILGCFGMVLCFWSIKLSSSIVCCLFYLIIKICLFSIKLFIFNNFFFYVNEI